MDKLVKVTVTGRPISLSNSVKAFGHHGPIMMSTDDIFKCLISDAEVIEINPNNPKEDIRLNLANFKIDNFKKEEPKKPLLKELEPITPLPNATPDMVNPIAELPNATLEMDGGVKNLDNLKEIADYVRENEELVEEANDMLILEATPMVGELHIAEPSEIHLAEPTTPAIEAVDEAIASDFIPKTDDKPNYQQNIRNNNHNHGKNKNRR